MNIKLFFFLQDNLHIAIRFRNNKVLEFDADTAEEKYTICRLLGIILGSEQFDTNGMLPFWLENRSAV